MLRDLPPQVEVGLHLTLTLERPLTAMPLARGGELPGVDELRRRLASDGIKLDQFRAEVRAQFDAFGQSVGRPPAFIDGHQHAHALGPLRALILAATKVHAPGAWMRTCADRPYAIAARPYRLKAARSAYGSYGFARIIRGEGLRHNVGFAGHYGFSGDYARIFPRFLRAPGSDHLVMCHPGAGRRTGDAIAAAREAEAAALRILPIRDLAAGAGLAFSG